jgi:hypothetical protein
MGLSAADSVRADHHCGERRDNDCTRVLPRRFITTNEPEETCGYCAGKGLIMHVIKEMEGCWAGGKLSGKSVTFNATAICDGCRNSRGVGISSARPRHYLDGFADKSQRACGISAGPLAFQTKKGCQVSPERLWLLRLQQGQKGALLGILGQEPPDPFLPRGRSGDLAEQAGVVGEALAEPVVVKLTERHAVACPKK